MRGASFTEQEDNFIKLQLDISKIEPSDNVDQMRHQLKQIDW